MEPNILLLTSNDPWGQATGGQTTFAKQLLTAFGPRLAVSSYCEDLRFSMGTWQTRDYGGDKISFLSQGSSRKRANRKPPIPARAKAYFMLKKYLPLIRRLPFRGVIVDSPEILFAASEFHWPSICYSFAGLNNPVSNSRYRCLRSFGRVFESYHISLLNRMEPDVMIAAADKSAIEEFHSRTDHKLDNSRFHQFPTRVDTTAFSPMDPLDARMSLGLPLETPIFVATGRISWIKGWDLLLESLKHIRSVFPTALLVFVGDGEDHNRLEERAKTLNVWSNIKMAGFVPQSMVAKYMNAANVCLVGSHREGWSLAMCEMIACGKPVVSTDVSGARDMVHDGNNGFVVMSRNPIDYADAVFKALKLEGAGEYSRQLSNVYSVENLAKDLTRIWKALQ